MSRRWLVLVILLAVMPPILFLPISYWQSWSPTSALLLLLVVWAVLSFLLFYKSGVVLVDETSVAVIFNQHTNNFAYFIDSKPKAGIDLTGRPFNLHTNTFMNKWLFSHRPHHHFINPLDYRVEAWITRRPQTASGKAERIRTKEGIPVAIQWSMAFNLEPVLIKPGIEANLARALPQYAINMLGGRVVYALRHIVEQKSVNDLYRTDAIKTLETEVREMVTALSSHLGFVPIAAIDTRLGPIEVPLVVEKAIEADHERTLQTLTAVHALQQLQSVINQFSREDMERLAELERLRILDTRGGSLFYGMASLINTTVIGQGQSQGQGGSGNGEQPSLLPRV
jgi:hypothetical protein